MRLTEVVLESEGVNATVRKRWFLYALAALYRSRFGARRRVSSIGDERSAGHKEIGADLA